MYAILTGDQPPRVTVRRCCRDTWYPCLLLLVDALRRWVESPEQVGIRAVEVDAIDEAAKESYLTVRFSAAGRLSPAFAHAQARDWQAEFFFGNPVMTRGAGSVTLTLRG